MTPIRYLLEESGWAGNWPRVIIERWKNKDNIFIWVIQVDTGIYLNAETLLFQAVFETSKIKCGFESAEEANEFWTSNRKKIFKKHSKREW